MQLNQPVHHIFKKRRVAICGGTQITRENALFCKFLGQELAREENIIIMTGGFKYFTTDPGIPSGDYSVIQGVSVYFQGKIPEGKVETLNPDPTFEGKNIERFSTGTSIVLKNKTLQARRFTLVNRSDVIVTVEGRKGTREIVDLAFAIEKPCLPVPFSEGFSSMRWKENRKVICEWFDISDQQCRELESISLKGKTSEQIHEYALLVKHLVLERLKKKCFIIMPFDPKYNEFYEHVKRVLNDEGFEPIRTDKITFVGNIVDIIRQGLFSSDCTIAEITDARPNVMYEIGLAHAYGKPVIMFTKRESISDLPFDIKNERIFIYEDNFAGLDEILKAVLMEIKQTTNAV